RLSVYAVTSGRRLVFISLHKQCMINRRPPSCTPTRRTIPTTPSASSTVYITIPGCRTSCGNAIIRWRGRRHRIRQRVADLVGESQYQQAIDPLDDALARSAADPALRLDVQVVLASTLWVADEYRRLAAVVDNLLPRLAGGDEDRKS